MLCLFKISEIQGSWTKLMVVGGYPESIGGKAEIYDLNAPTYNCPTISEYPVDDGQFGTFINNKSLVCGGYMESDNYYSPNCYSYDMQVILILH